MTTTTMPTTTQAPVPGRWQLAALGIWIGVRNPRPPPCGPQRAIHGPGRRSSGRMPSYAGAYACQWRIPRRPGGRLPLVVLLVGPVDRTTRGRLAPSGEWSGRAVWCASRD
jgi:hypothetical protein